MVLDEKTLKPLWIDYKRVNEIIDIRDVIRRYSTTEVSERKNIRCPSGAHQDRKPSAKIYTDSNICMCFTCQKHWKPLELYCELQGVGMDNYREVKRCCANLLEDFGIPLATISNINEINHTLTEEEKAKMFPFTTEEIRFIGFTHPYTKNALVTKETADGEHFSENISVMGIIDYYRTDMESCLLMIAKKCWAKMQELTDLEQKLSAAVSEFAKNKKDLETGRAIYMKEIKPLFKKQTLLGDAFGTYISALQALEQVKKDIKRTELIMQKVSERTEQKAVTKDHQFSLNQYREEKKETDKRDRLRPALMGERSSMVCVNSEGVITENKSPLKRLVPKKADKVADIEDFINNYFLKELKEKECSYDVENIDYLIGYKNSDAYAVIYIKDDVSKNIELIKQVEEAKRTGVYAGNGTEEYYKSVIQEGNSYYLLYAYAYHLQYNFSDRKLTNLECRPLPAYSVEQMIKRSNEAITELTGDEVGLQEDIYYYSGKDKSIYEKAVFDNEFPKEPFNYTIWSAMEKYGGERLKNCDDKSNEKMLYLSTMFNSEFNPEKGTTFETFEKLKKFYSLNDDRLTYTAEHLHFKDDKIIFTIKGRKEWSYNKEKFSDEVGATNYIAEDYRGLDVHALKNEEVTIYVRKDMYGHPLYLMNGLYISDMDELRETLIRANSFSKVDWYMYDSKLQDYIRNHDVKQAEKPAPAPVKKVKKKGFNIADLKIKKSKEEPEI